jgi:hypothetical protein
MPGARCTRSLACESEKHASKSPQVHRTGPAFPARWFYGLFRALPGERAFLPPSSPRSLLLENLTPASRRQDHTASLSATARFRQAHASRPSPPAPRFVTIAIRPSLWARDGGEGEVCRVWAASGQGCGKLARRANQVRRPKSCQVQSMASSMTGIGRGDLARSGKLVQRVSS